MKSSIALLFAASGLALAQLSDLPSCAMSCYTSAAGASSCQLTDFSCQCTTGRQAVQQALIPCLCQSECSSEDITTALTAGEKICAAALSSASQSYAAPTAIPSNVCAALASAMPSGSATGARNSSAPHTASASATGTSSPIGYSNSTVTGTANGSATGTSGATGGSQNNEVSATGTETGTSETGTASASLASSTGAASRMGLEGALVGLAGLAIFAL